MVSSHLDEIERRVRLKYEWSRARRAVVGFAPSLGVVALAALFSTNPAWAILFGSMLFFGGVLLLWYGRDPGRAVLPGMLAGLVPLTLALCAKNFGHVCSGEQCVTFCIPACVAGGLVAGLVLAVVGVRRRYGLGFWASASGVTLLTGAMGCACVGYSGVLGLAVGTAVGLAPAVARAVLSSRSPGK